MIPATSITERAGLFLLAACSILAPIPIGSNAPSTAGFFGLLLSFCLLGTPLVPSPPRRAKNLMRSLLLLAAFLILWSILQTVARPPAASSLAQIPIDGQPPIAPASPFALHLQPLHSLGYILLPLVAFISTLFYVRDDTRYLSLFQITLAGGGLVTALCIGEYVFSPQTLLLSQKVHYLQSFTGTFVNPNTAATYFGIMLLLSISFCLHQLDATNILGGNSQTADGISEVRKFVAYSILTIIFATALLITRSRGGILSTLAGLLLYIWAYGFLTLRPHLPRTTTLAINAFSAVVTVAIFIFYGGLLMQRLDVEGLYDDGRLCTYRATWQAIKDNFWLGWGLGSFQDVFPAYRLPECGLNGYWEMAHSVFLEAWFSLGISFFVCLVSIYYLMIRSYAYGLQARRRFRFVPLVSLSILVMLTLHSLIDFSLQVPAVAIVAAIALGAGAAVSLAPPRPVRQAERQL
jgi:O-antigen ligase